jgi:hypothetical protein
MVSRSELLAQFGAFSQKTERDKAIINLKLISKLFIDLYDLC